MQFYYVLRRRKLNISGALVISYYTLLFKKQFRLVQCKAPFETVFNLNLIYRVSSYFLSWRFGEREASWQALISLATLAP